MLLDGHLYAATTQLMYHVKLLQFSCRYNKNRNFILHVSMQDSIHVCSNLLFTCSFVYIAFIYLFIYLFICSIVFNLNLGLAIWQED